MKCPYINPSVQQCENCTLPDCVNDDLTIDEIKESKQRDIEASKKPIDRKKAIKSEIQRRYWQRHKERINEKRRLKYPLVKKRQNKVSEEYNHGHREELNEYGKANYKRKKAERVS